MGLACEWSTKGSKESGSPNGIARPFTRCPLASPFGTYRLGFVPLLSSLLSIAHS